MAALVPAPGVPTDFVTATGNKLMRKSTLLSSNVFVYSLIYTHFIALKIQVSFLLWSFLSSGSLTMVLIQRKKSCSLGASLCGSSNNGPFQSPQQASSKAEQRRAPFVPVAACRHTGHLQAECKEIPLRIWLSPVPGPLKSPGAVESGSEVCKVFLV